MDNTLFESKGGFLRVKTAETTPYFYAERKGVDSVAFILVDNNKFDKYGVTNERKPPMDERFGELAFIETAFGGSVDGITEEQFLALDEYETIQYLTQLVKTETREEAGYDVDESLIKLVSKEFVSTQMNQWAYLFIVDVTGIAQGKRDPQNATEAMANVVWKTLAETREMNDWKTKSILFTLND